MAYYYVTLGDFDQSSIDEMDIKGPYESIEYARCIAIREQIHGCRNAKSLKGGRNDYLPKAWILTRPNADYGSYSIYARIIMQPMQSNRYGFIWVKLGTRQSGISSRPAIDIGSGKLGMSWSSLVDYNYRYTIGVE